MKEFLTLLVGGLLILCLFVFAGFFDWITYMDDVSFHNLLSAWLIRSTLGDKLHGKLNHINEGGYIEADSGDIRYVNGYRTTYIFRYRSGFVAKTSLEDVLYLRRAIIQLKKDQEREALENAREKSKEVSELMKKVRGK